jgi:hypothetical protein
MPALPGPLAIKVTEEEGYRIEEGFLRIKIKDRLVLLQGLVVKKADAVGKGKLPVMIITHGTHSSANRRQEMTPRGTKDSDLRLLRAPMPSAAGSRSTPCAVATVNPMDRSPWQSPSATARPQR